MYSHLTLLIYGSFVWLFYVCCVFKGLYIRSRFTINPDKVYRMAMRRLNTSAEILEVMGAPLTGTDLRAYVMSGGGLTLKKIKPSIRSRRCFLMFPINGSERKGLVNVEVKKKKGKVNQTPSCLYHLIDFVNLALTFVVSLILSQHHLSILHQILVVIIYAHLVIPCHEIC